MTKLHLIKHYIMSVLMIVISSIQFLTAPGSGLHLSGSTFAALMVVSGVLKATFAVMDGKTVATDSAAPVAAPVAPVVAVPWQPP